MRVDSAVVDVDYMEKSVVPVVSRHSSLDVDGSKLVHGLAEVILNVNRRKLLGKFSPALSARIVEMGLCEGMPV